MDFSEFTGEVQHRLELGTQGEAVRGTRAVLTTLGERIQEGQATDLASSLPMEIDYYVLASESGQRFEFEEFVARVADRADVDEADATFYAQAVVDLLAEIVPEGELEDLQAGLPAEFGQLFELLDADEKPWAEA